MIAACAGCSRGSHLYYVTVSVHGIPQDYAPTVFQYHWMPTNLPCYFYECRVPFDATGKEFHEDPRKIVEWRTYTEFGIGRHYWSLRAPAWFVGLMASGILAAMLFFSAQLFYRASRAKDRRNAGPDCD